MGPTSSSSTSIDNAGPSSISRPTSHPSASTKTSEKVDSRFPSLPNLSEDPVTPSDSNPSEKVGTKKSLTKSKALDSIVGSLSKKGENQEVEAKEAVKTSSKGLPDGPYPRRRGR